MSHIYGLTDTSGKIRYVGKTISSLKRRLICHIAKAKNGTCKSKAGDWIRSLLVANQRPGVILLQSTKASWKRAEKYWIKKLRSEGYDLLNSCDGGNGSHRRKKLTKKIINQLGKVPDAVLAKQVGCSREAICYNRNILGIVKFPQDRSHNFDHLKGKEPWNKTIFSNSILELLGTVPDRVIAEKIKVSTTTINTLRNKLNIKSYIER